MITKRSLRAKIEFYEASISSVGYKKFTAATKRCRGRGAWRRSEDLERGLPPSQRRREQRRQRQGVGEGEMSLSWRELEQQ